MHKGASNRTAGLCIRYKKPLAVTILLATSLAILHSWSSLNTPVFTAPPLFKPEDGPPVPSVDTWLSGASAWSSDKKEDKSYSVKEAFEVRQEMGRNISRIFTENRPPILEIRKEFLEAWPQILPFHLNKTFDQEEIRTASQGFFTGENSYVEFKAQQLALLKAIPTWDMVKKGFSGRGIVVSAGSPSLARVWPNAVLMLRALGCKLPIEVWTKDKEEYEQTLPLAHQLKMDLGLQVSVHTLSDYMSIQWGPVWFIPGIFKVKALSLLYSSFDEIILLDADSVPVMDPTPLFDSPEAASGLIQWPDFWANSNSKILHDIYDIDYSMIRTCESGQMVIKKNLQFEPMVLATYYNWWGPDFFYKLIYLDSMGAGDKDTFYMGSAAYHRDYHVTERLLEVIPTMKQDGRYWKDPPGLFNGAMAQFNPANGSEVFFMHMHSPKINMQAEELAGQYDLLFFAPKPEQDAHYRMGAEWLEKRLIENLVWVECESVVRVPGSGACEGLTQRLATMGNI